MSNATPPVTAPALAATGLPCPDLLAVFTTVGSEDDAHRIAHTLVARRLAACVQIEPIHSVYRWHGEVQQDPEVRLLIKTRADQWDAVREAVLAMHPYELPALYALPVSHGHAPYAEWVARAGDERGP